VIAKARFAEPVGRDVKALQRIEGDLGQDAE